MITIIAFLIIIFGILAALASIVFAISTVFAKLLLCVAMILLLFDIVGSLFGRK